MVHIQFPLHPDVPEEGISLESYFKGRGFDINAMRARMKGLMDAEGLPYSPEDRIVNSRLAQELGKWGEQQGKPEIHDHLYRAHFSEGVNLADRKALAQVAGQAGLDAAQAEEVLVDRTMQAAVDKDWAYARELGVTGVPTFVAGGRAVVGAQPYEILEKLVRLAGAEPRSANGASTAP